LKEVLAPRTVRCRFCDAMQRIQPVLPGHHASCYRCHSRLCRGGYQSLDVPFALSVTALVCWGFANVSPFVSLEYGGVVQTNFVLSGSLALWAAGQHFLSILTGLTGVVVPGAQLLTACFVLFTLRRDASLTACRRAVRLLAFLGIWSMPGVYLIGVSVAAVKLADLATLSAGPGLFAWLLVVLLWSAASLSLDPESLEQRFG